MADVQSNYMGLVLILSILFPQFPQKVRTEVFGDGGRRLIEQAGMEGGDRDITLLYCPYICFLIPILIYSLTHQPVVFAYSIVSFLNCVGMASAGWLGNLYLLDIG